MADVSPKKLQKKRTPQYSMCFLYNTGEALAKLMGLTVASCNPTSERGLPTVDKDKEEENQQVQQRPDFTTVSEKMSCNYCSAEFESRDDQTSHYKSDWHRYNLQQRLKGANYVSEDKFEEMSGCISSISGSEADSDEDEDDTSKKKITSKPIGIAARFQRRAELGPRSSTDSDSDDGSSILDERARKYPKIFMRNSRGELISIYRCVVCHKHTTPTSHGDLISMVTDAPNSLKWAVLMASGGHFAGAIFDRDKILVHKTFHRYVVRAKRGTAQSSRDSQGNAPKSAGAALRRYNEAALKEDVRELLTSWNEHLKSVDLIFLRAPSFNKHIFFSGKSPPLDKKDMRIRMIPFQTKRPTHNEVRRVHQMLASIECYGDESDIQDFVPLSPQLSYSADAGQLVILPDERPASPKRKSSYKERLSTSPLAKDWISGSREPLVGESGDGAKDDKEVKPSKGKIKNLDRVIEANHVSSSGNSTASDSELVGCLQTLRTDHLKEFAGTKKPKRKKNTRKRRPSIKHQIEPENNPLDEEKYHLKNNLYTACKTGDADSLLNLLAVFEVISQPEQSTKGQGCSDNNNQDQGEGQVNLEDNELRREVKTLGFPKQSGSEIQFEIEIDDMVEDERKIDPQKLFSDFQTTDEKDLENISQEESMSRKLFKDIDSCVETLKINDLELEDSCADNDIFDNTGDNLKTDNTSEKPSFTLNVPDDNTSVNQSPNHESSRSRHSSGNRSRHSSGNQGNDDLSPIIVTADLLNERIGDSEMTLLMVAAKAGHTKLIPMLLKAGGDPVLRDKYGQTAYQLATDKETRNEFRRFMAKFPTKYDYVGAKVPGPLTEEMEAERRKKDAERKRQQKKAKQERDKEKRAEEAIKRAEEEEKKRYLALSDREKRAIAAEKRLKQQKVSEGTNIVLIRCFQCASDMTGKVPFEYFDFKFCSTKCLRAHRDKSKNS